MAPDISETASLYQHPDQAALSLTSRFTFHCHAGLACFNQCCQTPTVILSPYDLLSLSRGLGITSGEFLLRYTRQEIEPYSNLPLIFLDVSRSPAGRLSFAGRAGLHGVRPPARGLPPLSHHHGQSAHG